MQNSNRESVRTELEHALRTTEIDATRLATLVNDAYTWLGSLRLVQNTSELDFIMGTNPNNGDPFPL